jgi:glycosyltransferase involved in cell wall biosynthesis
MEDIKISFVIPIYNGSKFLDKCLNSLLNQNFNQDLFEIICVDDCSNDSSIGIVRSFQQTNPNVKLITNNQNLKTGTTCNIGVENATGKYIWIIGQDDWIEENCLSRLIEKCEHEELDVLAFNYKRVDESENELHSATVFGKTAVMKGDTFIEENFRNNFVHYLLGYEWRAIFNRNYLQTQKINFTDGAIYEDTSYLFKAIIYSDRFASIPDFIYNYRVNTKSITDFNKKYKGNLIYEFSFVAGNEVLDLADDLSEKYKEFSEILHKTAIWYFESFTYKIVAATLKEKRIFYSLMSSNSLQLSEELKMTAWYVQLLAKPIWGLFFSIILKPFYLLKRKIKNRNTPKQDWCY